MNPGVYLYFAEILFRDTIPRETQRDVSLVR